MRNIADQWLRDVLGLLYRRRSLTRAEILEETGLNAASASHTLRHLLDRGIVLKVGELQSGGSGRPREVLTLNSEAGYFVAVDLEGEFIRFALSNFVGDIRCRWEEDLRFGEPLRMEQVVRGIRQVLRDLPPNRLGRVLAAGVSYPGTLDRDGLLTAVNLGWRKFPIKAEFEGALELPVFLEHDKHTCILAEQWLGGLQNHQTGLFIIIERGIGLGISVNGRPVEGWHNMAGEFGHCKFDSAATQVCKCGQRGCLEAIASTPAIIEQYLARAGGGTPARAWRVTDVFEKARQRELAACEVVQNVGRVLGSAISNLIHLFNPEIVILGGCVIAGRDLLLPVIEEQIRRLSLPNLLDGVKITVSGLGLDIRLRGAASLAFRNSLSDANLLKEICGSALNDTKSGVAGRANGLIGILTGA